MKPTLGSLFAGIGGIDLGFERAGFETKWQVEIDEYASRVLAKHWPHVHRERDIRDCGAHNLERVDCIAGGFPCQDISVLGRGAGLDGDRSCLFFESVRLVGELQPRCVVVENVEALLSRGMGRVLGALAAIGYDAEWHCIPAAAVGAPHIRDRVFIVAYSREVRCERKTTKQELGWKKRPLLRGVAAEWWRAEPEQVSREVESSVGRVADGVSHRMDRLRGLGNAVVPQVAEYVAKVALEYLQ